jgi:hypothetical protein
VLVLSKKVLLQKLIVSIVGLGFPGAIFAPGFKVHAPAVGLFLHVPVYLCRKVSFLVFLNDSNSVRKRIVICILIDQLWRSCPGSALDYPVFTSQEKKSCSYIIATNVNFPSLPVPAICELETIRIIQNGLLCYVSYDQVANSSWNHTLYIRVVIITYRSS